MGSAKLLQGALQGELNPTTVTILNKNTKNKNTPVKTATE